MPLLGKPPEESSARLKLMLYGGGGSGKTWCATEMIKPYIIDGEKGTTDYAAHIRAVDGHVYHTSSLNSVIDQVRCLTSIKHDFKTLIIDPISTMYFEAVDYFEGQVGTSHGKHVGEATKLVKRLFNLIRNLDMNVVVTCHAKPEYQVNGKEMVRIGDTFDGPRSLEYFFNVILELQKKGNRQAIRHAIVKKTRIRSFVDGDIFPWSYAELLKRSEAYIVEASAKTVEFAMESDVATLEALIEITKADDKFVSGWMNRLSIVDWNDCPKRAVDEIITELKKKEAEIVARRTPPAILTTNENSQIGNDAPDF